MQLVSQSYKYVFIIGVSRTGSKFYMQLLETHKDISVIPEIMFHFPYRNDLFSVIRDSLKINTSAEELVDALYQTSLNDTSSKVLETIRKDVLLNEMKNSWPIENPYQLFKTILKNTASVKGKSIAGAKFPVHYSKLNVLLDNLEES